MRRRHLESVSAAPYGRCFASFVSSRRLAKRGSWGTAPSVFWYGAPGGTQGPLGKGGAAERWRVVYPIGIATRYGAKPATTRAYKSRPPPGRRTGFAPCKISAPPKAITNSAPKFFCLLFFTESIPRRRAVQALHPAKSPPRRQATTNSPPKFFCLLFFTESITRRRAVPAVTLR